MASAAAKKGSKYFSTTKRGEINELREELESGKEDRQKSAVKKIIQAMTVGKDVSALFPNVIKCMTSSDLELKKLVYLYIMNYAKTEPDLAILAVNSFVKDASSPSPLIRALAVRTMGCIHVARITEYLCQPLHDCLKDADPYVRKTAAVCVAKLYEISPELVETQGFLESLLDLLSDSKPMVVANAVAALLEIESCSATSVFEMDSRVLSKLLAALNECTEWGQVFILDALAAYTPRSSRDAETICERVTPRLQHANSAVVLGAVKLLIKYMDVIQNPEAIQSLVNKMSPPLVTLLSKEPEIQYVALRNINLIVQKRPQILQNDIWVFFCKYNDP
ncbi:MAG: HEAT repeat domain-containing protein, partial [archaeon]|nr:HEAT repeat domain-containing protein [archaeon]